MSLRSGHSTDHARSSPAQVVTNETVYQHALRVAFLVYLCKPKPLNQTPTSPVRPDLKSHRTSVDASWSTAFSSLTEAFSSRSSGDVTFPKDFLKVFAARLDSVVKGTDTRPAYRDDLFRACCGHFYGKFHDPVFQRQLKTNRKVEELILTFVTSASKVLKERDPGNDQWMQGLMLNVATFVRVITECLRDQRQISARHVSKELIDRLESYLSKLAVPTTAPPQTKTPEPRQDELESMDLVVHVARIFNVSDVQLGKDVQMLKQFCDEKAALRDLKTCISLTNSTNVSGQPTVIGTPVPYFPGRREDFTSDDSYAAWRKSELNTLQQLILALATANKDALKDNAASVARPEAITRPTSLYIPNSPAGTPFGSPAGASPQKTNGAFHRLTPSLGSSTSATTYFSPSTTTRASSPYPPEGDAEELDTAFQDSATIDFPARGYNFTFIPSAPRLFYRHLLAACLDYDLVILHNMQPDDEVSLKILSKPNRDILAECAIRWRIMPVTRAVEFLDEISRRYASDEIPLVQCVTEALMSVDSLITSDLTYDDWMMSDQDSMQTVLSDIFDNILRRIFEAVKAPKGFSVDLFVALLETLDMVHTHPLFQEIARNLPERILEWTEAIRMVAAFQYDREHRLLFADMVPNPDPLQYLAALCELEHWLKATVVDIDRLFKAPILQAVDVAATYLALCAPLYVEFFYNSSSILERIMAQVQQQDDKQSNQQEALIRQTLEAARDLVELVKAFLPESPIHIDLAIFEPYVHRWLISTDAKTQSWVQSAIAVDKFVPEGEDHHSSSIVDLIESCKGAVAFLVDLDWPDPVVNALFMTRLAQIISKALEEYCGSLETLFMQEMTSATDKQDPAVDEKTSAWLMKAKGLYQTDRRVSPFSFTESTLVKLNNIQAARDLLDKMYTAMSADEVSDILAGLPPLVPTKNQPERNLFSVKVVLGEDIMGRDEGSKVNPFLTLSDSAGRRRAKTRTLYDTTNPRWAETFDLSIDGSIWLAATVYHRNLVDKHDMLGRVLFQLDPSKYNDYLPHELWLNLNTHGHLLIRVSMEGESDDIQFYFGRAFRSLKRTESDMVRNIVDKMSPMIRHYLSRSTIKSLLRKGGFTFDLEGLRDLKINDKIKDIKLDKIRAIFTPSSSSSNLEIPPIEAEQLATSLSSSSITQARKKSGLTDAEIEDAIGLLFEYFEETFALLKGTLNDIAFRIVMGKIWKEILTVLEALLIPPMSSIPSDMRQLNDKEVYVVIRWLKGLSNFFYAGGEGVPVEDLHSASFKNLLALPLFYDLSTDDLMIECNRALNGMLLNRAATLKRGMTRSKSVYQQRNLGTIRQRKKEKRQDQEAGNPEILIRILRMRPNTADFLIQMLATLEKIQQEEVKPAPKRGIAVRGRGRGRPTMPPLPRQL